MFRDLTKTALGLFVLGALAFAVALPTAHAGDFAAVGTFETTGKKGNRFSGTIEGDSTLGEFTGTFWHKSANTVVGPANLVYDNGTLEILYEVKLDKATDLFIGTWVVTDATGDFAGTTGFGLMIVERGGTGTFWLSGVMD